MFLFRSRAIFLFNVVLLLIAISPAVSLAQQVPIPTIVPSTCDGPNCTICDLAKLAQNVANAGIFIAVFLSAVLFAYAGVKYLTAGGSGTKLGEAKQIFFNVGVGLIIILAAWLIVDSIVYTLTGRHNWNTLC